MRESRRPWLRKDRHFTVDAGEFPAPVIEDGALGPVPDVDRIHRPLAPKGERRVCRDRGEIQHQATAAAGLVARFGDGRVQSHTLGPARSQDKPGTTNPVLSGNLETAFEDQPPAKALGRLDGESRRGSDGRAGRRALPEPVQKGSEDDNRQKGEDGPANPDLIAPTLKLKVPAPREMSMEGRQGSSSCRFARRLALATDTIPRAARGVGRELGGRVAQRLL